MNNDLDLLEHQRKPFYILNDVLKCRKKIIVLNGHSGVGKSHLISSVMNNFDIQSILYLVGDSAYDYEDYSVFRRAYSILCRDKSNDLVKDIIIESSKDVVGVGNSLSFLLKVLLYKKKNNNIFNDEKSSEIYIMLQKIISKGKRILIFDNVYNIDYTTIRFIKNLILKIDYVNNLENIVLVLNNEKDTDFFNWLKNINYNIEFVTLEKPSKDVITTFARNYSESYDHIMSNKFIDFTYQFCDGNLNLLKLIILALRSQIINLNSNEANINKKNLLLDIIKNKLSIFGEDSNFIDMALTAASCIGLEFGINELEYVLEENRSKCQNAMKSSEVVDITTAIGEKSYKFTHELLRDLFLEKARDNSSIEDYYLRVERCLQYMRPHLYRMRSELSYKGEDFRKASILKVVSDIECFRESPSELANPSRSDIPLLDDHLQFKSQMEIAYLKYNNFQYNDCLDTIRKLPLDLPIEFGFEKDYLACLAAKKLGLIMNNLSDYVQNLEYYQNELECEYEMWHRCLATLLAIYYDCCHDKIMTRKLSKKLIYENEKRKDIDSMSEYRNSIILRKSKMIESSEFAVENTYKSLKYFENTPYHKQMLKSLCNHSGNLITLGRYEEAFNLLQKHLNYSEFDFMNNGFYLANNAIISGIYSHNILLDEGLNLLNQLKKSILNFDDIIIIKNNYCVLKALKGEYQYAITEFEVLLSLPAVVNEDYFAYFIGSNLVSAYLLSNRFDDARNKFNAIESSIPFICEYEESLLSRRNLVFKHILNNHDTISMEEFNNYFTNDFHSIEESWKHWGRSFIVSDLQYWSES